MKTPLVLDGRNIYDKEIMEKSGFKHINIGQTNQKLPSLATFTACTRS